MGRGADWEEHLRSRGFALDGEPPRKRSHTHRERPHLRALFEAAGLRWWRPYAFHIANERADPKERAQLAGCGIAPGLPDVWLVLPRPPSWACIVELKADGGAPSPAQEAWTLYLRHTGAQAHILDGWPAALAALDAYAGARRPTDPPPPTVDSLPALATHAVASAPQRAIGRRGVGAGERAAAAGGGDPSPRK